jgi:hypothetical protein
VQQDPGSFSFGPSMKKFAYLCTTAFHSPYNLAPIPTLEKHWAAKKTGRVIFNVKKPLTLMNSEKDHHHHHHHHHHLL